MTAPLLILIAAATLVVGSTTRASAQPVPPGTGIWQDSAAHALRDESRRTLVASLTRITGLEQLAFSSDGRFEIGDTERPTRGSRIAEDILRRAIGSDAAFVVQDHSGSPAVTFGQIEGMTYINDLTGRHTRVWWVRLDFADFRSLHGPRRVRDAFDPGFVLLHELLHAFGHHDDDALGGLGECERILNGARSELNLPRRADYAATRIAETNLGVDARLRFDDSRPGGRPAQVRHLHFSTHVTGDRAGNAALTPTRRAYAGAQQQTQSTFASLNNKERTNMNTSTEGHESRLEPRRPAGAGHPAAGIGSYRGSSELNDQNVSSNVIKNMNEHAWNASHSARVARNSHKTQD